MGYLFKKLLLLSFLLVTFASAGFESALKKQKFLFYHVCYTSNKAVLYDSQHHIFRLNRDKDFLWKLLW